MAYAAIAFIIVLPQIWAVHADKSAAMRVALLMLSLLLTATTAAVWITRKVGRTTDANGAYHDTYYVVAHFHLLAGFAALMLLLTVMLYAADRTDAPLSRWTKWFASLMALVALVRLVAPTLYMSLMLSPQRHANDAVWVERLGQLNTASNVMFCLIWLALFGAASSRLLRRWNAWSKGN